MLSCAVRGGYQVKCKPSCWVRMPELVLLKATTSEITPAFESEMLPSGVWRLAWLKTLNTSQLNSRLNLSVSLKFLCKPQSASNSPGPRSEFLVVFPKVNGAGGVDLRAIERAPGDQLTGPLVDQLGVPRRRIA